MKTTDIFTRSKSIKLNETFEKTFGQKLKLEDFTLEQLEDVRNRLRTHVHQYKQGSKFNETIENEAFTKAQWMLDTINAEIEEREEFIVDSIETSEIPVEDTNVQEFPGTWKGESVEQGEDMTNLKEGEIQQASAIVTAKTMVDRVGRWIEELSGMENDTLLQLGDSIRDEMGQEQAKAFISAVAPAIQQALDNLKTTRETLASGVRTLTGEEQAAGMLGADDASAEEPDDLGSLADPDAMNTDPEIPADDFAAAEPAAGGAEEAGRAKRESIDRGNSLLKVLAG